MRDPYHPGPEIDGEWVGWKAIASVVAVPLGFGTAVGIGFVLLNVGTLRADHLTVDWANAPAWVQAVGSVGAIVGAWLFGVHQHRRQVNAARIAATFEITLLLRQWITAIEDAVYDHSNHATSGGQLGNILITLPDLPFEKAPERVAALEPDDVRSVFDLIEIKRRTNASAIFILDVTDPGEASDATFATLNGLYLAAVELCNRLAAKVRWDRTEPKSSIIEKIKRFSPKEP